MTEPEMVRCCADAKVTSNSNINPTKATLVRAVVPDKGIQRLRCNTRKKLYVYTFLLDVGRAVSE